MKAAILTSLLLFAITLGCSPKKEDVSRSPLELALSSLGDSVEFEAFVANPKYPRKTFTLGEFRSLGSQLRVAKFQEVATDHSLRVAPTLGIQRIWKDPHNRLLLSLYGSGANETLVLEIGPFKSSDEKTYFTADESLRMQLKELVKKVIESD